ncbi:plasmid mobilization protein [Vibrio parahaemolyticus]|uniref:plasmid mobilization protein n=1 Tax=Vibrio parahaemolyticus TaxID=670 RepID=UPI00387A922B
MQQASTDIFSFLENPSCLLCEASSATPAVLEPYGSALKALPKIIIIKVTKMIKLTFEELIARLSKKELEQMRTDTFQSEEMSNTEKLERIQLIEIAIKKRSKRGRPTKSKEQKQTKKITANVTRAEQKLLREKAKRLGYKHISDYLRHICFNLTPQLRVEETSLPNTASEQFFSDTMSEVVSLLQYSLMQEKLNNEEVMNIFNFLQDIQNVVTEHRQQRIGEFDEQTAIVIANQFLSAEQLQELADNKALNDELSIQ